MIEPDGTQLSYTSSRSESPTVTLGVSDSQADYSFQVAGISDQPGSTLNLGLPPEGGDLNLQEVGTTTASVNLQMTRSSDQGVQVFNHNALPLQDGDRAQMQFGNWNNASQNIPLVITHNGQQSSQTLTNQQWAHGHLAPQVHHRRLWCRSGKPRLARGLTMAYLRPEQEVSRRDHPTARAGVPTC